MLTQWGATLVITIREKKKKRIFFFSSSLLLLRYKEREREERQIDRQIREIARETILSLSHKAYLKLTQ